jgi:hypothetical protein
MVNIIIFQFKNSTSKKNSNKLFLCSVIYILNFPPNHLVSKMLKFSHNITCAVEGTPESVIFVINNNKHTFFPSIQTTKFFIDGKLEIF